MLNTPGKVFGRVVIERIRDATKWKIGEEQCGFQRERGCMDQVPAVMQVMEKYCENNISCIYLTSMNLEKEYYRVVKNAMWQVLQMYARDEGLGRVVKRFYEKSKERLRVC